MNPETLVGYEIEGYFPFNSGAEARNNCPVHVELDHEGSLSWSPGRVAIELITFPKPAAEAMKDIVTIFNWMKKTKAVTKDDCGLHINVGLGLAASREPSWASVLGLSKSRVVAKRFGRENSHWCEPPKNAAVRNKIRRQLHIGCDLEKIATAAAAAAADPAGFGRRFSKLALAAIDDFMDLEHRHSKSTPVVRRDSGNGVYFEFRTPGGVGYHRREKDVLWATKIFVKAVEGAGCV